MGEPAPEASDAGWDGFPARCPAGAVYSADIIIQFRPAFVKFRFAAASKAPYSFLKTGKNKEKAGRAKTVLPYAGRKALSRKAMVKAMLVPLIRTVILYAAVMIAMRVLGKRQIGQMEPSDLVALVMMTELAAIPMQDLDVPLVGGLVPVVTLVLIELILSFLLLKKRRLRFWLADKPEIVVREGKIDRERLIACRLSLDELIGLLREQGENDVTALRYVIFEPSGNLSVIRKEGQEGRDGLFHVLIAEGEINRSGLRAIGKDEAWLSEAVEARGCILTDIYYMAQSDSGRLVWQEMERK